MRCKGFNCLTIEPHQYLIAMSAQNYTIFEYLISDLNLICNWDRICLSLAVRAALFKLLIRSDSDKAHSVGDCYHLLTYWMLEKLTDETCFESALTVWNKHTD